ncbi:replicative DNA helicase [Anaeromyxobacter paludicola]|uniref:Replicative DNA helicase n=1 Tax=Anaeromyxobacter paludicola TaxID=2918171 RepID=A0ABM7X9R5_9BACT|nr:replicative DNA helicase [Anaeromyxobacter paludicola]BDG08589.1 replicative DNA helicase [Anaeromyxobacter paludicola]
MPHSLEAEQAVLGALLIDETAIDLVSPMIGADDFHLLAHQQVFATCLELSKEAHTLDPVIVNQRLEAKGLLGRTVPPDLVPSLFRALGTAGNVTHYARVVQDLSRLRKMMLTAQRVVEKGYSSGAAVQPFLEAAQQEIFGAAQGANLDTLSEIKHPLVRAVEELDAAQRRVLAGGSTITGVPTGLPTLDRNTLGLQPGALVILAARPSVGKTALALTIATHAAVRCEKRVAFFSLEMPSEQLALRVLAAEAKLDLLKVRQQMLGKDDWDKIGLHAERIGTSRFWLDDSFLLSPVELRAKCRKIKRESGLDLVVVDYLQLMHAPSDRATQSREQEIATISRSLKGLAKELQVPVVALSQLNRGVEKRKGKNEQPMLSDLRESGAIEQDADIVMFLHRPGDDDKEERPRGDVEELQLIIAKQRQGPPGTIDLVFFRPQTKFVENQRQSKGGP